MAAGNITRTAELRVSLDDPRFMLIVVGAVVLALLPYFGHIWGETYLISLVAKMLIFAIAAVSLDLILGYGGMVSFGHVAYIGVGSYAVAVFSKYGIDNGYLQLVTAIAGSALVALFIGAISLRTSGVYFIMITLAFTQMLFYLGISLEPFGGDDGMNLLRSDFSISPVGIDFTLNDNVFVCEQRVDKSCKVDDRDGVAIYYAAYLTLIGAIWFSRRMVSSRFGMVIRGAKANPERMQAIGFPSFRYRLTAFALAGAMCGVAGFLYANHQQYVSPAYMNWLHSGEIIIMVILGGTGTIYGAVIGSVGLLTLEELLQGYVGRDYWQMVLGPLLVLLVLFANRGVYSLIPHQMRGVPKFVVRFGIFVAGFSAFVWLMSESSPILSVTGAIPDLPLYVIFASILVALVLRFVQEKASRDG